MDPLTIALASLVVSGIGTFAGWNQGRKSSNLQEESLTETMRSNLHQYEQSLEQMKGEYMQDQLAVDQTIEDIGSNLNYLDRWKGEYDLAMQSSVDEGFSQYQQMAANFGSGLVNAAETGSLGGSASLFNAGMSNQMKNLTGSGQGFGMGGRLALSFGSTALDMLSDRQTALGAVDMGYRSIDAYKGAMKEMGGAIKDMEASNEDLRKKISKRDKESALNKVMGLNKF